jgi:hypothetical protein
MHPQADHVHTTPTPATPPDMRSHDATAHPFNCFHDCHPIHGDPRCVCFRQDEREPRQ